MRSTSNHALVAVLSAFVVSLFVWTSWAWAEKVVSSGKGSIEKAETAILGGSDPDGALEALSSLRSEGLSVEERFKAAWIRAMAHEMKGERQAAFAALREAARVGASASAMACLRAVTDSGVSMSLLNRGTAL